MNKEPDTERKPVSDDKTVYIQRGQVFQDMGNQTSAIEDFEQAIRIDPQDSWPHFHLGVSLLKSRKIKQAITEFK